MWLSRSRGSTRSLWSRCRDDGCGSHCRQACIRHMCGVRFPAGDALHRLHENILSPRLRAHVTRTIALLGGVVCGSRPPSESFRLQCLLSHCACLVHEAELRIWKTNSVFRTVASRNTTCGIGLLMLIAELVVGCLRAAIYAVSYGHNPTRNQSL